MVAPARDTPYALLMPIKPSLCCLVLALIPWLGACSSPPARTDRPLVIAHRGASAYLPEHTLSAYTLAIAQGADYIEPDVVLTRDGVPICAHDLHMARVTDVAQQFPGRRRTDGRWYWIDFDLYEIKRLRRTGPTPAAMQKRATELAGAAGSTTEGVLELRGHTVATLEEVMDLAQHMSSVTGRTIGIIPEPKDPAFHAENGRPIEQTLVGALKGRGYRSPADAAVIQCFDLDALELMASEAGGREFLPRLVWLVSETPTPEELDRASIICHGLGPNRSLLETDGGQARRLLVDAKERGLALYPWTFKDDEARTKRFFSRHKVDGLFTDNPDVAVRARGGEARKPSRGRITPRTAARRIVSPARGRAGRAAGLAPSG